MAGRVVETRHVVVDSHAAALQVIRAQHCGEWCGIEIRPNLERIRADVPVAQVIVTHSPKSAQIDGLDDLQTDRISGPEARSEYQHGIGTGSVNHLDLLS